MRWLTRWLTRWLRPSLTRRVVLVLLLGFALAGAALLAQSYIEVQREFSPGADSSLSKFARAVATSLEPLDNAHDAAIVLQTIQRLSNQSRQQKHFDGILLVELLGPDGQRVYVTPELRDTHLNAPPTGQRNQLINGHLHRVTQARAGPWLLRFAEPQLADGSLLSLMGGELVPSLLVAFPFVLLPIWFAVRQGLRPVRQLSARLAQRRDDDLSALDIDLRYAELQPVVAAFNELLAKLRDKVARERAFVQDAAHELRTPMAVIAAQAHVLARAESDAERHQASDALHLAIERASHLAQQLLALAALDDGRPLTPEPLDLAHLLQNLLAQTQALAQQRGIELALEAPDSLPVVTDRAALQSIVLNLLDNAVRYGHPGGLAQVTLEADAASGAITITVADDGPGIPEDERAHIFDRFVRGRGQHAPGTGLGLAIVKQAAQRLQAHLTLGGGLQGRGVSFAVSMSSTLTPPGNPTDARPSTS